MTLIQFLIWFSHARCVVFSSARPPQGQLPSVVYGGACTQAVAIAHQWHLWWGFAG